MAQSASNTEKKLIKIDVTSDSVCPWCFVGKKNLDKALASLKDQYEFEINWHPYLLDPSAPKEGINKKDFYKNKFGSRADQILARMTQVFKGLGLDYDVSGLTGSSLDSHRLILFAGKQGLDKQHNLVEELMNGYFTQGKFINDKDFLVESARKVGIEGADEFLQDPNNGLDEINAELGKYSANISGVPYYVINGKHKLSGGQPEEVFLKAFQIYTKIMAQSASNAEKKLIKIDVTSDSVCPWCFVGKKNLDKALASSKDQYEFEINWHPYLLDPSAPKEGINKKDFYKNKFGSRADQILARMTQVFKGLGLDYDVSGLTGSSLDSHRLILFAGKQGHDKQHNLVEELMNGYFTQGKFINDKDFLVESARKVGIEGADEFLQDPNNGLDEINEELGKYSANISGVPHYVINGKHKLSGGQPEEVFLKAFQVAAN